MVSFSIIKEDRREYKRFKSSGKEITVKLSDPADDNTDHVAHFNKCMKELLDYCLDGAENSDMVGLTIFNEVNSLDKPIGMSYRRKDQIDSEVVEQVFHKVCQSNARFCANDTLRIVVNIVTMPVGNGHAVKTKARSVDVLAHLKRSIVKVTSLINCLAYAIIIAIAKLKGDPDYGSYRRGYKIDVKVKELLEEAQIDLSKGGGIPELKAFQNHFYNGFRIVVYSGLNLESVIFDGDNGNKPRINLLYDSESKHYHTIINLNAAMALRFICPGCSKGFKRGNSHICDHICYSCRSVPPCDAVESRMYCEDCNRSFRGALCFANHKVKLIEGRTVCDKVQNCKTCNKFKAHNHQCFKTFCNACKSHQPIGGHFCFMAPLKDSIPASKNTLFIFYDIETTQNTQIGDDTFLHVPNLLCVEQSCFECENSNEDHCSRCGLRKHSFWENPIDQFMDYLRIDRPLFQKIIVIAHNARSFDLQFILAYAIKNSWTPDLVMSGCKILSMKFQHFTFLDSLNFLPMPLRQLPKTFGITDVSKGFYLHDFNTFQNLDYVGPYPDVSYYGADSMSEGDRRAFLQWHESVKDQVFNNKNELETYCQADVSVLRKACVLFKNLFRVVGGLDIFQESITIASACNKVYRKKFLKENTIGLIPAGGYRMADKCSKKALMWLVYETDKRGISIQHAGNGKEVRLPELPNLKVDGYCSQTREVFEFLGCYFHGCLCLPNRDVPIVESSETLAERYESTMQRIESIVSFGYTVHVMWECDFKDTLNKHPALLTHPVVQNAPLVLRESLYGGRTEAMTLYHETEPEKETIQYVDVMSLYPWVCKYYKFPIGHPTLYIGDDCNDFDLMLKKEGVIKCSILPPQDLYHPVLPYKCNHKLMFCLCRTCAETGEQGSCPHVDEKDRILSGTWIVDEVREAVSMGYKIKKIQEFYEYKTTLYDRKTKEGGLFVSYIDTFLKIKAESSGYPSWVMTEEDKTRYINSFLENEGILLDRDNIVYNPGKRAISKLCLNSFWGKLVERSDRTRTKILKEPKELYEFLSTPGIEITNLLFSNDQVVWITWKHIQEETPSLPHTNVVLGSYVTTGARLKLYKYLRDLGRNALYCDTDSVIYCQKVGEKDGVDVGDNLGEMTNELLDYGKDAYISHFVSGGPKNYAYKVEIPSRKESKTVCKVRGIILNYSSSKMVNFETIKRLVFDREAEPVTVRTEKKIKRKPGPSIVSELEDKKYRVCFGKRRRLDNNGSLPFGHI